MTFKLDVARSYFVRARVSLCASGFLLTATTMVLVAEPVDMNPQIANVIEQMATARAPTGLQYRLDEYSDEQVVAAIIHALRTDVRFRVGERRFLAYDVLTRHKAARFPEGYRQLVDGLNEGIGVQEYAVQALAWSPPDKRDEVIKLFHELIRRPTTSDSALGTALWTLGGFGPQSLSLVADIRPLFEDRARRMSVRKNAAVALLRIEGPEWLITHLSIEDPAGYTEAIYSLMIALGEPQAHFVAQKAQRAMLRSFIISAFQVPDVAVRKAAIEVSWTVCAVDPERESRTAALDELESELRGVAEHDPDPSIRDLAQRLLDGFPKLRLKAARLHPARASQATP